LLFENGDVLYGALESIGGQQGIRWHRPDAAAPIEFVPDRVREIHFRPRAQTNSITGSPCRVLLASLDELEGSLVAADPEKLVIDTWYAGQLTIARATVRALVPLPTLRAPVFSGPTGLEDWTIGKVKTLGDRAGEWRYKNGAFYATQAASIARDVKLPDLASLQFDLAWKGMLNLALALFTDYMHPISLANKETEPPFTEFYSMQINSFSVNLLPVKQDAPLRSLGQVSVSAFNRKNAAHVEIRVDKPKRIVTLMVDGQVVKQWTDPEEFTGKGTGIRLVHQGQGSLKLTNLRVTDWDGQFEEKPSNPPNSQQDLVKLRNGDRVVCDFQRLHEGKVLLTASGAPLEIPLSRVKQIEMAGRKTVRPKAEAGDVRAFFHNGASVTFRLAQWDERGVVGASPSFGQATFNPLAFARVQFNVHRLTRTEGGE
jgi:hypothetical protein